MQKTFEITVADSYFDSEHLGNKESRESTINVIKNLLDDCLPDLDIVLVEIKEKIVS